MNTFLGNFSMSLKLLAAIGGLVIMTAGLGGFAIYEVSVVGQYFSDYRQNARQSIGLAEAQKTLSDTRLSVMKYRIQENEETARAVIASVDILSARLAAIKELNNDPILQERLLTIEEEAQEYRTTFQEASDWQAERNQHVAVMDATGPAIRKDVSDIRESAYADGDITAAYYASIVQEHLMLGRLYAAKFLVENNNDDAARAREEFAKAKAAADTLSGELQNLERRRLLAAVQEGLLRYTNTIDLVEAAILSRNDALVNGLDALGPLMFANISSLAQEAIDNQNTIGPMAQAEIVAAEIRTLVIAAIIVIIGALIGWALAAHIKGGIERMTTTMRKIADGDLSEDVPFTTYKDELGAMAGALGIFKANAEAIRQNEALEEERREKAMQEKRVAMEELAQKFERDVGDIVNDVATSAQKLRSTSSELGSAVQETSGRSGSANEAVQMASANVQAVAAATEELAAGVDEVSRNVARAAEMARSSAAGAERAGDELKELRRSISEVDAIIVSINDVAEQTNLLALNATIEAARAGEAGKGFTVVANEVKTLASQTKAMTDGISTKVDSVKNAAFKAIEATEAIISEVRKIDSTTTEMAASVEQQSSATSEISRNAQEAAVGTSNAEENVVNVQSATHQTEAATGEVSQAADLLSRHSDALKRQVSAFLAEVRAA